MESSVILNIAQSILDAMDEDRITLTKATSIALGCLDGNDPQYIALFVIKSMMEDGLIQKAMLSETLYELSDRGKIIIEFLEKYNIKNF